MNDYINREAAKEAAWENIINRVVEEQGIYGYLCNLVNEVFDAIPAADVVPARTARWTEAIVAASNLYDHLGMMANMHGYVCSCCQDFSVARYNFCPNCGADMRGNDG